MHRYTRESPIAIKKKWINLVSFFAGATNTHTIWLRIGVCKNWYWCVSLFCRYWLTKENRTDYLLGLFWFLAQFLHSPSHTYVRTTTTTSKRRRDKNVNTQKRVRTICTFTSISDDDGDGDEQSHERTHKMRERKAKHQRTERGRGRERDRASERIYGHTSSDDIGWERRRVQEQPNKRTKYKVIVYVWDGRRRRQQQQQLLYRQIVDWIGAINSNEMLAVHMQSITLYTPLLIRLSRMINARKSISHTKRQRRRQRSSSMSTLHSYLNTRALSNIRTHKRARTQTCTHRRWKPFQRVYSIDTSKQHTDADMYMVLQLTHEFTTNNNNSLWASLVLF